VRRPEPVALAVLLVVVIGVLMMAFQRPQHLVLVSWPSRAPGVELTPRLDALIGVAEHAARRTGPSVVDTLAAAASQSSWVVVEGRGGPEAVMSGVMDAVVEELAVVVVLRLDGSGPAQIDDQLGRTLDGLAAILAPSRTLYLLERPDELYAVGPGQGRLESPADGISVRRDLAWTLKLR
jgi:hypothetical protein